MAFHTDPFYAECRAYGRIKDAQTRGTLQRQIAIPCHGFLFLKDHDKQLLEERGIDLEEDLDNEFLLLQQIRCVRRSGRVLFDQDRASLFSST